MFLRRLPFVVLIASSLVTARPRAAQTPQQTAMAQRPTDVTVVIANSRVYAGTFHTIAPSRVCGELPAELNFAGVASFVVEFPDADNTEITNVTFGSTSLVGGTTTTGSFRLDVGVKAKDGGRPPNYVLNTDPPNPGVTGTATRTSSAGTDTLKVTGRNEMGETIEMTLVCKPRPK
jgi:hypothetical protein